MTNWRGSWFPGILSVMCEVMCRLWAPTEVRTKKFYSITIVKRVITHEPYFPTHKKQLLHIPRYPMLKCLSYRL
jgi:hypothetical protein